MNIRLLICVVAAGLSLTAGPAAAWWSEDWTQRKTISIDTTAAGANTQTTINDASVLVRLHAGNFPQFLSVRDNAADLRFVSADDLTPLKYHVERFDPIAEMAFVWVKLPVINAQTDQGEFFMYFGNQAAPRADDPGATFDVNTVAALHFRETSGPPMDATAYGTPVTAGGIVPNTASIIGNGATLTGTEALTLADAPQLGMTADGGWTFETWVRLNGLPAETIYLMDRGGEDGRLSISILDSQLTAAFNEESVTSFTPVAAGQWHHVVAVVDNGQLQLYLDGAQVGGVPITQAALAGPVYVGGASDGTGLLAADIDELRVSNVARQPDWIAFGSAVQGSQSDRVLRYSIDEGEGGGQKTTGNFGIIFQNVFGKKEAWVEQLVIIICGLMMAIAAAIMFLRAVALKRSADATRKFLHAYGDVEMPGGDDDRVFGARAALSDSPLWRVYHVGIEEVQKRHAPAVGAQGAGLDSKAMSAIRAAMDSVMVREGQRLNSQLVLLTIAISGGPFIGLFGTVVGVMVTFAAIAATGDVNIAAIAPGMAAALLATVAGLGVAIPSLFGYNYLGSRAKDQIADMRVFADELEARLGETYGA